MFKLKSLKLLICMFAISIQQNCEAVPDAVSYVGANWAAGNSNNWRFKVLQDYHNLKFITPGKALESWPDGAEKSDMCNDLDNYGAAKGNKIPVSGQRSYSNNQNGLGNRQQFLARRVVVSEVDYDTLQRGANTNQMFENKVYTVNEDGTLEFKNETISGVIFNYFVTLKGRSSLLLHCVQSTPDAVLREVSSSQLLNDKTFQVTPLLSKMLDSYTSKTPKVFEEFKVTVREYFEGMAQKVSNVNVEAPFDIVPEVVKILNSSNTKTYRSKALTELKKKISLIDFALIFRLDDGVIHVGIIPVLPSEDVNVAAVLNQFDNNGLLKATENFVRESKQSGTRQDQDDALRVSRSHTASRL